MFEALKAKLASYEQAKLGKEAPASARDQEHALHGYSLWLIPPLEEAKPLRELIFQLSKEAGSPAFMPHVTLFTAKGKARKNPEFLVEALQRGMDTTMLERAVAGPMEGGEGGVNPGLRLHLTAPQIGDHYYQSVLSPVEPSSAGSLTALHSALAEYLHEDALPFFPHMSLCYGSFSPAKRQEIAEKAASISSWPKTLVFNEAAVVDITGTADEWKVVDTVRLM